MTISDEKNQDQKFIRATEILTGAKPGTKMPEELVEIIKIAVGDDKAEREEESCIGCGVCAYFCPENAISMVKTPLKIVRIMPPHKK